MTESMSSALMRMSSLMGVTSESFARADADGAGLGAWGQAESGAATATASMETAIAHFMAMTSTSLVHPQHGQEGLLRDVDAAHALHPLLAFLLLLEQLALAGDVAAVALRDDVLAQRLDRLARDHARADGGLDGHLEHLARAHLADLLPQRLA